MSDLKTLHPNVREFLDRYDEIYDKCLNCEAVTNDEKDLFWNSELYFAKAILNDYSNYREKLDNPAVKIAKIILAVEGMDNVITIKTEIK